MTRKCFSKVVKIQDSGELKKEFKDFRSLFYQMDRIWEAPSGVKKSIIFIYLGSTAISNQRLFYVEARGWRICVYVPPIKIGQEQRLAMLQ